MTAAPRAHRLAGTISSVILAVAVAVSGGCVLGPDYRRPAAVPTMPDAYAGATGEWKVATPQADLGKGPWWELFGDPALNELEEAALVGNQEVKASAARLLQARALTGSARSGIFPRVGAAASASVQHDSANRPLSTSGEAAGKSFTYESYSVPFDVSYELDLWGRVRRQMEAARAGELASAADLETVKLSIAAEVAADYFACRALEVEARTLSSSIAAYARALELTRQRRRGGLAQDLDVAQAETVLAAAEAQLPAVAQARLRLEHALAVLVGQPASLFHLVGAPAAGDQPALTPPLVRPDLPSTLLERRPDVAAAEERMASANASIGVAKAAFFPTIRLTGVTGLQSTDAGSLLDWPSRYWALGPSLSLPLFDGGQRRAGLDVALARYDETVALYRQTVLKAFAEVEDQLAAQRLLQEQREKEEVAWASAVRQLTLAENRYRGGLVSYLQVTSAQSAALDHERTVARLRGQQFAASIALVKALGGGWAGLPAAEVGGR